MPTQLFDTPNLYFTLSVLTRIASVGSVGKGARGLRTQSVILVTLPPDLYPVRLYLLGPAQKAKELNFFSPDCL